MLRAALNDGVGLGEWLVAGPQLMKKLRDSRGPDGMYGLFADLVIAWYRTGLNQPLDEPATKRLWLETLPTAAQQRLIALGNDHTEALFSKASAWACEKVIGRELYEQAIITRTAGGYEAHDYVVDQTMRDGRRAAVPDPLWD